MTDLARSVFPESALFIPPPDVVVERMMTEPTLDEVLAWHAEHDSERVGLLYEGKLRAGIYCKTCRVVQTVAIAPWNPDEDEDEVDEAEEQDESERKERRRR